MVISVSTGLLIAGMSVLITAAIIQAKPALGHVFASARSFCTHPAVTYLGGLSLGAVLGSAAGTVLLIARL